MKFDVGYTLATLGNPPPRFFMHEAIWWGEWSAIGFATRRALRQLAEPAATAAMIAMLRDQDPPRPEGPRRGTAPPDDASKRDGEDGRFGED